MRFSLDLCEIAYKKPLRVDLQTPKPKLITNYGMNYVDIAVCSNTYKQVNKYVPTYSP